MALHELRVLGRKPDDDPVRELEPRLLSQLVEEPDEIEHTALPPQLVVELGVDADRVPVRVDPAGLLLPVDEHVLGRELVPGRADAAAGKLLDLAAGEGLAHRAELLPEAGPEHRQVRPVGGADVRPRLEGELLHAQLVADHVGPALGRA